MLLLGAIGGPLVSAPAGRDAAWPQWGGPRRDFTVDVTGLARQWPAAGPRRLWSRPLGEGHSAIVAEGGVVYTAYRPHDSPSARRANRETVIALDAATGRTLWEHSYEAPTEGFDLEYGAGPHATPLIAGHLLVAAGSNQQIMALDRRSGKTVWSHDLPKEFGSKPPDRGYACSPLLYKDTVITQAGGAGQAVIAFRVADGRLAWKNQSFDPAPSSPLVVTVDGQDQLVIFAADAVVGLDPADGRLLWRHGHRTEWGLNISTPVFGPDNQLFISSAYNSGSRLLQLRRAGDKTQVQELWYTNRMRVHFGTVIRIGNRFYGSSGDFGPAFMTALDASDGRVAWQNRGFARASLLWADGMFVILDEDGALGLARPSPEGLEVLARAEVLSSRAWTVPTLVGTVLYARDRKNIVALELGAQQ
jgi:outer membrane protein assembly factor BamB